MQKSFETGDLILSPNQISNYFYIIVRGKIRFEMKNQKFFLSDGDFFGEEGLFFKKVNPFSVIAAEQTLLQILNKQEAEEFINNNRNTVFALFIRNVAKFCESTGPISDTDSLHIKILETVFPHITVADSMFPDKELSITSDELAAKLEITTEELLNNLNLLGSLGFIKADLTGKIFTTGKNKILTILKKHCKKSVFADAESGKGSGIMPLINVLNKNEKKCIVI